MKTFEEFKNKINILTEQPGDFTSKQRKDNINMLNKMFGSKERSKKTAGDVKKTANISNKKETQRQKKIIKKNVAAGDKLLQDINKRKSADLTRADAINRAMGTSGSTEGAAGAGGTTTKTKTVSQAEVSKKAQDFTKEINKKNKNRTFFDPEKAKEARKNLIAKRKEYGIDRKGNISDAGVKRYAQKTKQLSSGSNVPAKVTSKDLKVAKVRAVGGEKVTNKSGKVIGTTTGKYGGRLGRVRNRNMKTYDQIKKDIDLKDLQKASDAKARKIARSQELKDLTKKMGEKELQQRVSQQATLKSIRPQRQFYKGAMKPARVITKAFAGPSGKVAPVVKTGLKVAAKAGPVGAIAAGTGLALLNPSIRKTAKKVAKAALGAAGVKAFTSKPKLAKRPPSKIGINLSPKA